jgi:dTDP-4-dehydrorhamnose 3,5-epimerase
VTRPQAKLLRVVVGEVFDVAVDIRRGSPTFGRWCDVHLSAGNFRQLYIPPGFAHGFCVMSDVAEIEYKCSDVYVPEDEITIRWDDPAIGVRWPGADPLLSERDRAGETLAQLAGRLPIFDGT